MTSHRRLLAAGLACVTWSLATQATEPRKVPLDFELSDGQRFVRLSEMAPKATVINFWRADCPPCVQELPALAGMAREGRVRLVAVALQPPSETMAAPAAVIEALAPPVLSLHGPRDPRGLLARFGNRQGALPHTVVLDAERRPCGQHTGEVTPEWIASTLANCPAS